MARSFNMAVGEYLALHARSPLEPLLPLCIAVCKLQAVMSRTNAHRGHAALVGASWLGVYARQRSAAHAQEVAYNRGRAYHHLGLVHLAVPCYVEALLCSAGGARSRTEGGAEEGAEADAEADAAGGGQDLSREAAYNLACICKTSGNHSLAQKIVRTFMTI